MTDERVKELEAEVERLREQVRQLRLSKGPALFEQMMDAVLARAEAAEAKVEAIHARRAWDPRDGTVFGQTEFPDRCGLCRVAWPCVTVAALADAPAEGNPLTDVELLSVSLHANADGVLVASTLVRGRTTDGRLVEVDIPGGPVSLREP